MTASVALRFAIGARTLFSVRRRLEHRALTLEECLSGSAPPLPPLSEDADGYFVRSVPRDGIGSLAERHTELRPFVRQAYSRCYAVLEGSFDDYLAGFPAKRRSSLRRKLRRFTDASGGRLDLRCYRSPEELDEFHRVARPLSARTYQERLLGAGLPEGDAALAEMRLLAGADSVRAWILFLNGAPAAYLYAPARGNDLVYAFLGYDPDYADMSPGTVLQFETMRQLFDDGRFRRFDFTEGDGRHKRQFATGRIECADLLLLRPTAANLLPAHALGLFDRSVARAKEVAVRSGAGRLARGLRR